MHASALDSAAGHFLHFARIKRLADIVIGTKSKSLFCGLECAEAGQHDDREVRIYFADLAQSLDASHSGHANVHDDGIGLFFLKKFQTRLDTIGGVNLISWLQEHAQTLPRTNFIINDENLGLIDRCGHSASGGLRARGMPQRGGYARKLSRKAMGSAAEG